LDVLLDVRRDHLTRSAQEPGFQVRVVGNPIAIEPIQVHDPCVEVNGRVQTFLPNRHDRESAGAESADDTGRLE
jgi:hypothetical protein